MPSGQNAIVTRWDDLPRDKMRGAITRRFVTTEKQMLAQITLDKHDDVPAHRHHNEQITYVITGAMKFLFGDDQVTEIIVRAGEVVIIPPNLLHSAVALEDTFELDIFSPPRADWIGGDDAYLRT